MRVLSPGGRRRQLPPRRCRRRRGCAWSGDAQVLPSLAGGPAEGQSGGHGQVALVVGQKAQAGLRPNPAGEAQVEGDLIAEGDRLHHHLHLVVPVGPGP